MADTELNQDSRREKSQRFIDHLKKHSPPDSPLQRFTIGPDGVITLELTQKELDVIIEDMNKRKSEH